MPFENFFPLIINYKYQSKRNFSNYNSSSCIWYFYIYITIIFLYSDNRNLCLTTFVCCVLQGLSVKLPEHSLIQTSSMAGDKFGQRFPQQLEIDVESSNQIPQWNLQSKYTNHPQAGENIRPMEIIYWLCTLLIHNMRNGGKNSSSLLF